jgi:hypothetical protein
MRQFPQIGSMAAVQYPLRYSLHYPRTVCELPGGTSVVSSDAGPGRKRWAVELRFLSDEERAALEGLFLACRGQLEPFRWLDPAANLLKWSSGLDHSEWIADPGVALEGAVADPTGGTGAWRMTNGSQTQGGIRQSAAVARNAVYTGSCWARAAIEGAIRLHAGAPGSAGAADRRVETAWRRLTFNNSPEESEGGIDFSVTAPPGGQVEIYGPQLEYQAAAGGYRPTGGKAGVYAARFNQDYLPFTATGPGEYSTAFEVISIPEA